MRPLLISRLLLFTLLISASTSARTFDQKQTGTPQPNTAQLSAASASATASNNKREQIIVPVGTRLLLLLRNGINTRTAKPGDSVYCETVYPITANNRVAIPMGSFIRGEILEAKRPGRIRGRGVFRIALEQITFPNGYTIELRATPGSVDRDGREGVDSEGKIKGPSSAGRDTAAVLVASGGGAYVGTLVGGIIIGAPGRGALIGGGAAGLSALIALLATRGPEAELPRGTTMDVVFDHPLILDAALLPANAGAGVDPQPQLAPIAADTRRGLKEVHKKRIEQSLLRSILLARF